ncbi:MFS transporter [Streptomyces sp. NBC_00466]|uniref:MFS transporter n=1 Tax=Streptomyces sp. NBC_00466 TaxID=2903655 RepID=UPI0030E3E037
MVTTSRASGEDALPVKTDGEQRAVARRSVAAAAFGHAMEWYDFSVYAFFAGYIAHNFFRDGDATSALVSTFVVFGAGFVTRPLGAVIGGSYADRIGRKAALMLSIGAMGIGTLILAVTPSATLIGAGAPILLLIARLFQGFSTGGEIGGAAAFLVESAPADRRALYSSWLQASMGISNLLAALVGFVITSVLPESAVQDWAWRIPFVLGLLIIPVGLYIRRRLPETEAFTERGATAGAEGTAAPPAAATAGARGPLRTLLAEHRGTLGTAVLVSMLWTVCVYAFLIYLPTYYEQSGIGLGFTSRQAFLASLLGNIVVIGGCLTAGRLADRVGTRPLLVGSATAMIIVPMPCLMWLHAQPRLPVLLIVHAVLCATVSGFSGVVSAVLPRAFPVAVRSTGLSVSYNIAAVLFAGTTPVLMTWATSDLTVYAPALWVIIGSVCCLAALPALYRHVQRVEDQQGIPED